MGKLTGTSHGDAANGQCLKSALIEKQLSVAFISEVSHDEGMPSDRASLVALRELIADTDLTLETTPDLPQNRTAHCRENLRAALALADNLIGQQRMTAAAVLGHKGGSATSRKLGVEHYRAMAAARKTRGGGRPRKTTE
jgi:hypothetical protein